MNITPALPNPYQAPVDQDRSAVTAVRAPNRTRDAADEPERRRQAVRTIDQPARERIAARLGNPWERHAPASAHASRALASYAAVADNGERSGLQDLLGFDAYA